MEISQSLCLVVLKYLHVRGYRLTFERAPSDWSVSRKQPLFPTLSLLGRFPEIPRTPPETAVYSEPVLYAKVRSSVMKQRPMDRDRPDARTHERSLLN